MRARIPNSEFLIPNCIATLALLACAVSVAAQDALTRNGGVAFINPGSPTVADAEATSQAVPRLPDGKIDLTGPWVGGGAIQDIEANGGLEPGELPLLPWARELRDKRRSQDDPYTVCLPMSVLRTTLEFICHEDNQYGSAGKFQPGTGVAR